MYARWGTFAIGMGLMLAPLLAGYQDAGAILHDITLGLLVCVLTLAALETPPARFLLLAPAAWLLWTGARGGEPAAASAEVLAGALLVVGSLLPRARLVPRLGRAGVRA
jgi:hypothetical protein